MENENELNKNLTEDCNDFFGGMDFYKKEIASENATLFYQKILNFMLGPDNPAENLDSTNYTEAIAEILCTLSPRERDVLRLRFGMDDGRMRTLEEVGQLFGVTKENIRLIEAIRIILILLKRIKFQHCSIYS